MPCTSTRAALVCRSTRYHARQIRSTPRHFGSPHYESRRAGSGSRLRNRATAATSVSGRGAGSAGVALPGAAPARVQGASGGRLEGDRNRARSQNLPTNEEGPEAARAGDGQLGASDARNWHDPQLDGRRGQMTWWYRLWRKKQLDAQLDKELDFHLEQHIADLIQEGYDPQEARRRARLELGGPEQVKESTRDARGTRWLEDFGRDVRYSFRTLRHKLGFSAVTLLTLALGIGATTIMFTVVDGVLLKPLPFPEPERLVVLQEQTEQATQYGNLWAFAYPNFLDVQRESRTLSTAASRFRDGTVSNPGEAEYVSGREVSSNFLGVLGVSLLEGRGFLPEEDSPGAAPVAILREPLSQAALCGG